MPVQQQQAQGPLPGQFLPENFGDVLAGVNSAVSPDLIGIPSVGNQVAWMLNGAIRGGKPQTRPSLKFRMILPSGLIQGAGYFGVQQGMGVISGGGRLFRLRVNGKYLWEEIALEWRNSALVKQVFMQQTIETLVVQDFESNPILYDGSTATRSDPTGEFTGTPGVPRGRQMAYGNGRLWVAVDDMNIAAGDIRQKKGSELIFTESNYLVGGGDITIPNGINAMAFIATNGSADYGPLVIMSARATESVRADISARDQWGGPGFVTNVLRSAGCAGHWAVASVNQDIYWRDSDGGIRSLYASNSDESSAGSSPISREVSRLTDYDFPSLLRFCSAIYFDNRLIVTSSPYLNEVGGVSWRDLISLDFAPYSVMKGKSSAAYDGQWTGLNVTHLFTGQFNGRPRAFAVVHHDSGSNALWEIMPQMQQQVSDQLISCSDTGATDVVSPISCYLETAVRSFGNSRNRKSLARFDVYLSEMNGQVDLKVWWRADGKAKWNQWDALSVNAKTTDPQGPTPHTWKNLAKQSRAQLKSFTIPQNLVGADGYGVHTGFEFQFRVGWTGRAKIYKMTAHATAVAETPYARRDLVTDQPIQEDITGNQITYSLDVDFGFDGQLVNFTTQPAASTTLSPGDNVTLHAVPAGAPPISLQWQESHDHGSTWNNTVDGTLYSGSQTPDLAITNIQYSMDGYKYRCTANNGWSNRGCTGGGTSAVDSHEAEILVPVPIPVITSQPPNHYSSNATNSFGITATGAAPLSYQWQLQWWNLGPWVNLTDGQNNFTSPNGYVTCNGTTTNTLSLNNSQAETGSVRCVVTNPGGSATSNSGGFSGRGN